MTEGLRKLIRHGRNLDRQHKLDAEDLKIIKTRIIRELGQGRHEGTDKAVAAVTFPAASLEATEDLAPARKILEGLRERPDFDTAAHPVDELLETLFATKTEHKPVSGFREIVKAILPTDVGAELIALIEKPSAPQCRFS